MSVRLEALDGDKKLARLDFSGIVVDAADLRVRIGGARQYVKVLYKF